ncbi:restriction endonuclease, partial [Pseudomonas syringae]|nr:restriction endonuclease [Pseudomonas syringae]
MTGMRVSGSGSTEIVQANQQQAPAAVANAHPDAVSPGSNPPLTASQSARQAGESSAAGTARLRIAPRHQQKLQEFRAEQATVPGTATPKISPRAALL